MSQESIRTATAANTIREYAHQLKDMEQAFNDERTEWHGQAANDWSKQTAITDAKMDQLVAIIEEREARIRQLANTSLDLETGFHETETRQKTEIATLRAQITESEQVLAEQTRALAEQTAHQNSAVALQRKLEDCLRTHAQLTTDFDALYADHARVSEENISLRDENARLTADNARLSQMRLRNAPGVGQQYWDTRSARGPFTDTALYL